MCKLGREKLRFNGQVITQGLPKNKTANIKVTNLVSNECNVWDFLIVINCENQCRHAMILTHSSWSR